MKGSGGWHYTEQVWKALAEAGMKGSGTASIGEPFSSKLSRNGSSQNGNDYNVGLGILSGQKMGKV